MERTLQVRRLRLRERDAALVRLQRHGRANLLLTDAVHSIGSSVLPGESRSEVVVALEGSQVCGVASLQPTLGLESGAEPDVVEALLPHLASAAAGLLKTDASQAETVWRALHRAGRRALLDRIETGYAVGPDEARLRETPAGAYARSARPADLEALVEAARASLREENRPDPFEGDPKGFRRWVSGRIRRAVVVEAGGRLVFVGYADVQRKAGWLLQGVYTWPEFRRRGLAAAGVSELSRRAFAQGANHVQLAVVQGNSPAEQLYESLGFERFVNLRTVLFA
ncbi:MAG: GNAT family N-acetyltransferase [Myxococcales bacterium]|nr:GNAT family N-acetyltransferase [Myxococcales bacterium]